MQQILLTSKQLCQKLLILSIMVFIALSGTFIVAQPACYATMADDQLSAEDKIERAYEFGEGAGILEEARQEKLIKKAELFDPSAKADIKSVEASKQAPQPSLVQQAQKVIEKVTGK